MESRKAQIRDRIDEGVAVVNALLEERSNLDSAREEADEQDLASYHAAHREWYEERSDHAGENSQPAFATPYRDRVERRAVAMPKLIDEAQLEVAKARLDLVLLEGAEALAEEQAPREKLKRIEEEVAQLERERQEANEDVTSVQKRAEVKMEQEFAHRSEINRLEEAVNARTRVASNWGVVVG
jgi:predicted nuclease with TOPRIM domain